jgi:hypothetical protein
MNQKDRIAIAERLVREAGFISPDVGNIIGSRLPIRKTITAWGPDESGEVINPSVAIGLLEGSHHSELEISDSLRLLESKYGDVDIYVLAGAQLWALGTNGQAIASAGVTRLVNKEGPWTVINPDLIEKILRSNRQVHLEVKVADGKRDSLFQSLEDLREEKVTSHEGQNLKLDSVIFYAVWRALARKEQAGNWQSWSTPLELTGAMANLARVGGFRPKTVLDPFMGAGDQLLGAVSRLPTVSKIFGFEIHPDLYRAAQVFMNTGKSYGMFNIAQTKENAELSNEDTFSANWPKVDMVIGTPPFGVKLGEPCLAPSFVTRDSEIAAIDKGIEALNPGGRMVMCTTRGWTFRGHDSAKLREAIANRVDINVAAIIGLPNVFPQTSVELCLVVIDKVPKGETYIAELGADWQEQLQPGSQLMQDIEAL